MGKGGDRGPVDGASSTQLAEQKGTHAEQKGMNTDFYWVETDEPHATRRKQILAAHPEIRDLFGPDKFACPKVIAVVLFQLSLAYFVRNFSWPAIALTAYCVGAFCNHNLFLAIHELSHNLAFNTPIYNRILGIVANLPIGAPMSVTFQKYHLEHHRYQGWEGIDMDIPTYAEGRLVTNMLAKVVWVFFQLVFYALRPVLVKPKPPGLWEGINTVANVAIDIVLVYCWGWKALGYLALSSFLGGGLHPMAGHFIAEHYVFLKGQETYSYYGPLNFLAWHVGYHNEHHDFPRIPGCRLHKVRDIAPEFYEGLAYHTSWTKVIWDYITDPTVGPFSRVMRQKKAVEKKQ